MSRHLFFGACSCLQEGFQQGEHQFLVLQAEIGALDDGEISEALPEQTRHTLPRSIHGGEMRPDILMIERSQVEAFAEVLLHMNELAVDLLKRTSKPSPLELVVIVDLRLA